jgi:hypothetical protein
MCYEDLQESGRMNDSMQLQQIEVQQTNNWNAELNTMAVIAGMFSFNSCFDYQKRSFFMLSIYHNFF